jgi:hypothetical protein
MKKIIWISLLAFLLNGCVQVQNPEVLIREEIKKYDVIKSEISLGDTKNKVVGLINNYHKSFHESFRRDSESYIKENGVVVDIHYALTNHYRDGLISDDEYTPYIFNNNKLVGIGWSLIGGPKTQGQIKRQTIVMPTYGPVPVAPVLAPIYIPSRLDFPKPIPSGGMFRY